jgi:hypothetical protein
MEKFETSHYYTKIDSLVVNLSRPPLPTDIVKTSLSFQTVSSPASILVNNYSIHTLAYEAYVIAICCPMQL